jgi:hypothetical protein
MIAAATCPPKRGKSDLVSGDFFALRRSGGGAPT